ncbi:MAG: tetratricopeptide repeat protein [Bacteroidota bacterium]
MAQTREIDSLKQTINSAKEDTNKIITLLTLNYKLYNTEDDSVKLYYANYTKVLSEKLGHKKGLANAHTTLGTHYYFIGHYPEALKNYFIALKVREELHDRRNEASLHNNLGLVYYYQNNYSQALTHHFISLKLKKVLGDSNGVANSFGNIGNVYSDLNKLTEALKNHFAALRIQLEIQDKQGIANSYNNIGIIYDIQGNIAKKEDKKDSALSRYGRSLNLFFDALKLREEINDVEGITTSLAHIGGLYNNLAGFYPGKEAAKRYQLAEDYCFKALKLAKENEDLNNIKEASMHLSNIYDNTGKFTDALKYYRNFISARDSLLNEENTQKTVRLEMTYEFDKKEAASKLDREKKAAIASAESKKQKITIFSVCGILLVVIAFAIFAYCSYLQKQKINVEITKQKQVIEEKQKEILDSIRYAKRIQTALLTSEKYINRNLNKLHKP